jgi:hypothetical protein
MAPSKRNPPFRAEHCGSLLRPEELVKKRYDIAAGKADASELAPLEDKSIADVVKLQKDAGFHIVSSGEYTRSVSRIATELLSEPEKIARAELQTVQVRQTNGTDLGLHTGTCSGVPFLKTSTG